MLINGAEAQSFEVVLLIKSSTLYGPHSISLSGYKAACGLIVINVAPSIPAAILSVSVGNFQPKGTFCIREVKYSPFKYVVWPVSLATASATCLLRYAGHQHYPTDLLAGALTGSFVGWFVPFMHKKRERKKKVILEPVFGRYVGIKLKFSFCGS